MMKLTGQTGLKNTKKVFEYAERYFDRADVPAALKTKKEWAYMGRVVLPKALPKAVLGDYGPLDCEEIDSLDPMLVQWAVKKVQYLYSFEQTREFKSRFDTAYHRFLGLLCRHSCQKDFIEKPRDNLDAKEWPHSRWPLRDSTIKAHVLHKRVVGVIGSHYTNDITFDVDYHEADDRREFFLARCQVFHRELGEFFIGCPWFAEHRIEDIGGCHFRVLVKKMHISKARNLAQEFLRRLDRKCPTLAAIESFTKIEVYPVPKGDGDGTGLRLPLCRGRVTVTDRHLAGSPEQNCIDLMDWIAGGDWKNLPGEQFMAYLNAHTPEHACQPKSKPKQRGDRRRAASTSGMGSVGSFKGCYYPKLIDFWTERSTPADDTIGIWLCGKLRALKFEGIGEQEALEWVESRLLSRNDTSFSDRLNSDFKELMRVTRLAAAAIWASNGYQPRVEESNRKLTAAVASYNNRGVFLHDPATWDNLDAASSLPVDLSEFADFSFTYDQRRLLKEHLHPVLCVEDVAVTYEVARRVVLFVHKYPTRELAGAFLPFLCPELGVHWHKNKYHEVLKLLCREGFLEIVGHKKWRGPIKGFNQARRYGLSDVMAGAFSSFTSNRLGGGGVVSIISHSDWWAEEDHEEEWGEGIPTNRCERQPVSADTS